ncbi:MAG: glycyl-radical enzyme activating protein [Nitrospirae bacterium]|nr:glycyl-radical enzyme activating protein [Nitrospirota bacterium]
MMVGSTAGTATGVVFDIQRFSIHDGPGIRTTVFFKGCPLRCPWCQNPESLRPHPEPAFREDRCRKASHCIPACTAGAMTRMEARIRRELCDACGVCVDACPHGALEVVGRRYGIEELVEEVARDRPFFASSGGGITLSGGEPTLQMEFAGAFARRCAEVGVGVGLQTCGLFRWEAFQPYLPLLEFIQFDLKIMSPEMHREVIGADNAAILSNARRLIESGVSTQFRVPVVPGYTDDPTNLLEIAAFLRGNGVVGIHLLRYHAMGEAKLARVGFPIEPLSLAPEARGSGPLEQAAGYLRSKGLEVTTWE